MVLVRIQGDERHTACPPNRETVVRFELLCDFALTVTSSVRLLSLGTYQVSHWAEAEAEARQRFATEKGRAKSEDKGESHYGVVPATGTNGHWY